MTQKKKEDIITHIKLEVCSFGSLRLALKVFRRLTGNDAIRKRSQLISYLKSLPEEALIKVARDLDLRLAKASYPQAI